MFTNKHREGLSLVLLELVFVSLSCLSPSNAAGFEDVGEHWLEIIALEIRVNSGNDDAEELNGGGDMYLDSSDLELTYDDSRGNQTVGLRFNEVQIDRGAKIHNAYIQFTVDETEDSNPCNLTFTAQAVDNAEPFTSGNPATLPVGGL